jgi:hypothetical protein
LLFLSGLIGLAFFFGIAWLELGPTLVQKRSFFYLFILLIPIIADNGCGGCGDSGSNDPTSGVTQYCTTPTGTTITNLTEAQQCCTGSNYTQPLPSPLPACPYKTQNPPGASDTAGALPQVRNDVGTAGSALQAAGALVGANPAVNNAQPNLAQSSGASAGGTTSTTPLSRATGTPNLARAQAPRGGGGSGMGGGSANGGGLASLGGAKGADPSPQPAPRASLWPGLLCWPSRCQWRCFQC